MVCSRLTVGIGVVAIIALLAGSKVDVEPLSLRLRGGADADADIDVPLELRKAVQEWRSRVASNEELAESVRSLKASHKARSDGRELRDHTIVRAMQKAKAKRTPMFSLEWAKKFNGVNPFNGPGEGNTTAGDSDEQKKNADFEWVRRNLHGRRQQADTDQILGIGISALSPGFPWNPHLLEQWVEGDPLFYCAGAELTDPPGTDSPIRPTRDGFMTVIDCEAIDNERTRSQIEFEYTSEGELNFTEISANDPFADPWGWCAGLKNVNKNQLLRSQYCDKTDITQVWRILPWDNTWRPDAAWWNIDGDGLCVELSSSNLTQFETTMQLERCTYDDQAARQRQTWIWCYEQTTCEDDDSTPPNFEVEIECDLTDTQSLTCSSSTFDESTATDDGAGAVQESIYDELNDCEDDTVRDQRWGRSQVYLVTGNDDQNLIVDFDSTCDDDGDDANTWMRVYTKQSDGEYDCEFIDSTQCEDRRRTMSAVIDPNNRDFLVIVTADGTDRNDATFEMSVDCSTSHFVLIQFRGNDEQTSFCLAVDNSNAGTDLELKQCDPDNDLMLWELTDERLIRLRSNSDRCIGVQNANNNQRVELFNCNPDQNNQRWRYDNRGDNEFSLLSNSNRCITTEDGSNPSNGDLITITDCDGNNDQRWNYGRRNPFPSPTPSTNDEYCYEETLILNVDSDDENLPSGSFDRNACLRPSDVFEDEGLDNLRNTWRYYDTQGIPFILRITSKCSTGRGADNDNSAGYTLFRIYEVDEDGNNKEFECRFSDKTECEDESDDDITVTFNLDGKRRYLFVATGAIEQVTVCEVSDDCTQDLQR